MVGGMQMSLHFIQALECLQMLASVEGPGTNPQWVQKADCLLLGVTPLTLFKANIFFWIKH